MGVCGTVTLSSPVTTRIVAICRARPLIAVILEQRIKTRDITSLIKRVAVLHASFCIYILCIVPCLYH